MRSLRLGFALVSGVFISFACGSTHHSDSSGSSSAGAPAGGATSEGGEADAGASGAAPLKVPPPVACGLQRCKAIVLGGTAVAPCCADPAKGICGADVSELLPAVGCQPLTQAGALDPSCPSSSGAAGGGLALLPAPGCCNEATRQCGYFISNLGGLLPFAPGCLDSKSLGGTGAPRACGDGKVTTPGDGGAGGESSAAGGSGGAAGASVMDGAGAGAGAGATGGAGGEGGRAP